MTHQRVRGQTAPGEALDVNGRVVIVRSGLLPETRAGTGVGGVAPGVGGDGFGDGG